MAEYIERKTAEHVLEQVGAPAYAIHALSLVKTWDVAPVVHGRWDMHDTSLGLCCTCSVCGSNPTMQYRFCPYCGARMDGE